MADVTAVRSTDVRDAAPGNVTMADAPHTVFCGGERRERSALRRPPVARARGRRVRTAAQHLGQRHARATARARSARRNPR